MLLTCGVAVCCCVRARGQRIQQRRRAHHARQFERSLESIRQDRWRNPTGSMREGYSGSSPGLSRSVSDDLDIGPRNCSFFEEGSDLSSMFEDQMPPRRIRCNLVPQVEVDSLNQYYRDWLNSGQAPSYIVAFINPHSGDQSAGVMEAEFKRLLAGPRRELDTGIGMVCHLG